MQKSKYTHSLVSSSKVINFDDWILGFKSRRIGTYGNIADYYYVDRDYIYVNEGLDNLCFVHGDIKDLENGKKCVVRNRVAEYNQEADAIDENGYIKWTKKTVEKAVIHLKDGSVILVIGITPNGNSVIVMK